MNSKQMYTLNKIRIIRNRQLRTTQHFHSLAEFTPLLQKGTDTYLLSIKKFMVKQRRLTPSNQRISLSE
jgi:hypothetical protein